MKHIRYYVGIFLVVIVLGMGIHMLVTETDLFLVEGTKVLEDEEIKLERFPLRKDFTEVFVYHYGEVLFSGSMLEYEKELITHPKWLQYPTETKYDEEAHQKAKTEYGKD